jgi:hypothetical protein
VDEVAVYFAISVRTVYRLLDEGGVAGDPDQGMSPGVGRGYPEV